MSPAGSPERSSWELMRAILEHLDVVVVQLEELHRKTNSLLSGHNALVEILRHQGRRMSKLGDSIRQDDAEAVRLFDLVGQLINKINNGTSNLDPDAQQAFDALHQHFQAVAQEVEDASAAPAPTDGGTQPPATDGTAPAEGGSQPFSTGPDAGTVGV
jgi:ABC-type transporter Mla subunit MlaD